MTEILIVGCIVMCAMMIEGIIGFGAAVFALPFLTMLIPVGAAVPLMSSLSILLGIFVVHANRKSIDFHTLRQIFLYAGIAFVVGMAVSGLLSERVLKIILGVFVTGFALRSLLSRMKKNTVEKPMTPFKRAFEMGALIVGGALHGAFACGGPLMVIYISRRIRDKLSFRTTMAVVWIVFGGALLLKNAIFTNTVNAEFWKTWICVFPFFVGGCALGNKLHHVVSVEVFSVLTDFLILCAGVSTLLMQLLPM